MNEQQEAKLDEIIRLLRLISRPVYAFTTAPPPELHTYTPPPEPYWVQAELPLTDPPKER